MAYLITLVDGDALVLIAWLTCGDDGKWLILCLEDETMVLSIP